jgi:hypothetical protein
MRALALRIGVPYVSLFDLLCNADGCRHYATRDVPLQFDYGHLTREGSSTVAGLFKTRGLLP